MLQKESRVKVVDNSGGKIALIFGMKGRTGGRLRNITIGDIVKVTIKKAIPFSQEETGRKIKVKKGEKYNMLIVRTVKPFKCRKTGQYISFGENAGILLNANFNMIGTTVFGDVPKEVISKYNHDGIKKVLSLVTGGVL
jgi:large subunit ribosomal protein L14